jgi:hypothetical protein
MASQPPFLSLYRVNPGRNLAYPDGASSDQPSLPARPFGPVLFGSKGDGLAPLGGELIYWIASALAILALGFAAYVALEERSPFNWSVAVFASLGVGIWLVGWAISRLLGRP